ncbi:MAG: cation-translocating P-type ATPase [Patescibacteria group bacterium]
MQEFYHLKNEDVFQAVNSTESGLSPEEAKHRLKKYGLNIISKEQPYSRFKVFISQFKNPLIYILLCAIVLSLIAGEIDDSQVIAITIFINVIIGYIQEDKANNALNKLKLMVEHQASVMRSKKEIEIPAAEIVVGDVLVLRPGRLILADARLFKCEELETNEASLTGESSGVMKSINPVPEGLTLADRKSMVYAGTSILNGGGLAVVIATGKNTEIGKISEMIKNAKNDTTPLQKRLTDISKFLGLTAIFSCVIVVIAGLLNGFGFLEMLSSATAIAVAAIPESMAVAVTVILAIGMKETVKKKALTRKLLAAETLGSITVICSDKTGTLTEGVMKLDEIISFSGSFKPENLLTDNKPNKLNDFTDALKIGILCNNAVLAEKGAHDLGSALEISFLHTASNLGLNREKLIAESPRLAELPFSSDRKIMISLHKEKDSYVLYEKGAGEIILEKCTHLKENGKIKIMEEADRKKILNNYENLTSSGLRVIALAYSEFKKLPFDLESESKDWSLADKNLTFIALASFKDSLRKESKNTIALCKKAGIRPIIITGDHPGTAYSIALELKICTNKKEMVTGDVLENISDEDLRKLVKIVSVYARVSPEHKIRIVKALKHNGEVVAMTGDGLNDSPALKAADIGICLGSGTEVAKETADIVLLDDNFSVIVDAIKQGRIIFDNIRKSLTYLVTGSFSEMILILGSISFHTPLALLPTQILWINVVNGGLSSFSLAFEKSDNSVMSRPAIKRDEPIFNKEMKAIILGVGLTRDFLIFALFFYFASNLNILGWSLEYLRTLFFAILIFKSLSSIFSIRSLRLPIHKINHFHNPYLFFAFFTGIALMILAVYNQFLNNLLKTAALDTYAWLIVIGIAIINIIMIELVKAHYSRSKN